jgi:hypothetical protein
VPTRHRGHGCHRWEHLPAFPPHTLSTLQVHGPLLRLNHVSPPDSGEYSCQVTGSSGTLEASVLVTIEASSPGPIPGEWQGIVGKARSWGPP